MEKINIRGVLFDNVTMDEAVSCAEGFMDSEKGGVVFTPNSEIVQLCIEDEAVKDMINGADLIIPDGQGVIMASKILKRPLKEKVAGVELAERLVANAAKSGRKFFFYGSKPASEDTPSVADLAAKKLSEKYPGFEVCGTCDGYIKDADTVIEKINASGAECLFVCLGVPKQEKWISENREKLCAKLIIGLGGSLDVFAGTVKRAPKFMIKLKLEWFYRLLKEPKRIGRMMKLPKFILGTVFSKKEAN